MPRKLNAKYFGNLLRELMEEKNVRQSDIARALFGEKVNENGYYIAANRQTVNSWYHGAALPTRKNLKALCQYFDKPPHYFYQKRISRPEPVQQKIPFVFPKKPKPMPAPEPAPMPPAPVADPLKPTVTISNVTLRDLPLDVLATITPYITKEAA